ncbi:MAG: hypothetical protein RJA70_4164, partial [Pseudomonadota bacterium]
PSGHVFHPEVPEFHRTYGGLFFIAARAEC